MLIKLRSAQYCAKAKQSQAKEIDLIKNYCVCVSFFLTNFAIRYSCKFQLTYPNERVQNYGTEQMKPQFSARNGK